MARKSAERLSGKTAVITGGASGIGAAAVRLFAEEGAKVAIADINDEGGNALAAELCAQGYETIYIRTNIADKDNVLNLLCRTAEAFGKIDILVSNAGMQGTLDNIQDYPVDLWYKIMDINLNGSYLLCKYGIPYLREAGGGSIVITGSLSAYDAAGMVAGYAASKAAVCSLAKSLAYDYGRDGIRVNALCPASVNTALFRKMVQDMHMTPEEEAEMRARQLSQYPSGRLGTPEDIAELMLFLAGDESAFMSGGNIFIDGGYWAGIPGV